MGLCKSNMYPTTLHAINSAVLKLGKLMKVQKVSACTRRQQCCARYAHTSSPSDALHPRRLQVYRGVAGKGLPEQMLKTESHGLRGGIEVRARH